MIIRLSEILISIVLVVFIPGGSYAYTRFNTTCTAPTTRVNFVSSPDTRGTLDILWSCVFTLIACTWTIQHLNIPEQRNNVVENWERRVAKLRFLEQEPKPDFLRRLQYDIKSGAKALWGDLVWGIGDAFRGLTWMLITLLAPELILGKAMGDFLAARSLKKKMEKYAIEDKVEWSLSHGFFAEMGGFRVIARDEIPQEEEKQQQENSPQQGNSAQPGPGQQEGKNLNVRVTEGHREFSSVLAEPRLVSNQQLINTEKPDVAQALPEPDPKIDGQDVVNSYILSGEDVLKLRDYNIIARLPNITTAEIHDRSKSNVFVKAVTIIQIFWISLQVIVRSARGLAISQLELVVTAFSLCAIMTYLFLIPKPQGVQIPMRPIVLERIHVEYIQNSKSYERLRGWLLAGFEGYHDFTSATIKEPPRAKIPNDFIPDAEVDMSTYFLGITFGGTVFGAIHVAGWNLIFPTSIEQDLWHISSIIVTCLLPAFFGLFLLTMLIADLMGVEDNSVFIRFAAVTFGLVPGVLYSMARLFLLVETFRTLAYLPPDAFISTWVSNIPNVS